ncbi:MAG: DUF2171 domain-containing protein [Chloroflexota bacterium]|nr:DUF2171 domain-containing protein [Chloroflexota bacterium]
MALGSRDDVREGMIVVGSDGGIIGTVKEVRNTDLLVSRSLERDVYVPLNAIHNVIENLVSLNIPAEQVSSMHWPEPPLGE